MLNSFLETFTEFLDIGRDKSAPIVLFITTTIAVIDFTLAFIYQYSEDFMNVLKIFFQKLFKYATLFALIRYFGKVVDYLIELMFIIGYKFFPEQGYVMGKIIDFDTIYSNLLVSIININKERSKLGFDKFGDQLIYLIIMIVGLIAIFLILKEIIISFIKLKTMSTIGYFLIPFNAFEQTKAMGEKLFHGILAELGVLLTAVSLTGITLKVLETRAYTSTSTGNTITLGDSLTWLFMLLLCAFLVTQAKEFGSMLINGTAAGKGSGALATGLTSVAATGASVVAAAYTGGTSLAAGSARAAQAIKSGKNLQGVLKSAREGMKAGKDYAQSTRLAKAGRRLNSGIQKTIAYGSGQRNLTNLGGDLLGGVFGTIGDQTVGHNTEEKRQKKEALFEDTIGELKDYAGTHKINNAIKAAKAEYTKALEEELKDLGEEEKVSRISKYRKATETFLKQYNSKENRMNSYRVGQRKYNERKEFDNPENRKKWKEFRDRNKFVTGKDKWGKFRDTENNRKKFYEEKEKEDAFDGIYDTENNKKN
ncbi:hypothetical protein EII29_02450 [Leptotrichia sp. OH3620_COT-345]|uniref:type IV secretion system protein n=1 Tax=Leptotrichia sp. OH3620_COT-345 TaxID=2491048 RepID=UPI000F650DC1|nr:type IV secretion system protein [Leptotrichia sp. OH3620_COT-345]RRD40359.1 hypothetical protein EII29_02450 [Leptotrichia sp. OH3620_COT-345]